MAFIRGKKTSETIDGTADNDTIEGRGGDDTIRGLGGNDLLKGGSGADHVFGGMGDDTVNGGSGDDLLFGDEGNDSLLGGNGVDTLEGGQGSDILRGGKGNDILQAGEGDDTLDGGNDFDTVVFSGLRQDYTITQVNEDTVIIEGPDGIDRVVRVESFQFADVTQSFAELLEPYDYAEFGVSFAGINLLQSDLDLGLDDVFEGSPAGAEIAAMFNIDNTGTIGNTVTVRTYLSVDGTVSGDDLLLAEDVLTIAPGTTDFYTPTLSIPDSVLAGDYKLITVVEYPGEGDVSNNVAVQDITLVGGRIAATDGDDVIAGTENNDLIDAGAGNDTILASNGIDSIDGGAGTDTVDYSGLSESVLVLADDASGRTVVQDWDWSEDTFDNLTNVEAVVGTDFDDGFVMQLGLTYADGGDGNDVIQGWTTDDTIIGGNGDDSLVGYTGSDSIDGGAGTDTAYWDAARADFVVTQIDANTVEVASAAGVDIVTGVEFFAFTDGTLSFDEVIIPPEPNVSSTNVQLSSAVVIEGDELQVSWDVISDGDVDADASTTEVVIATAPDMNAVVERFGVTDTGPLATGTTSSYSGTLYTFGLAPGTYYVAAVADSTDQLSESNETDNVTSWTEVVIEAQRADYALDDVTVLPTSDLNLNRDPYDYSQPAGLLDLQLTATNNSNVGSTEFEFVVFLSTDDVLSEDDFMLSLDPYSGSPYIQTIEFGETGVFDVSIELPEQFPQGDYHVIAAVQEAGYYPYGPSDDPSDNIFVTSPISLVGGWSYGTDGDDLFVGNEFYETFEGGAGNDTLKGNLKGDVFLAGDGIDTLDLSDMPVSAYETNGWSVTGGPDASYGTGLEIIKTISATYGSGGPVTGYADSVERVIGSNYDDVIAGAASSVTYIDGGAGNDQIVGSFADDVLLGGDGDDFMFGHLGDDTLTGGEGNDTFYGVSSDALDQYSPNGHDVVTDFDIATDLLLIVYNSAVETFDPFANLSQTAEGALITISAESSVLLQGIDMLDLNGMNLGAFEDNPYVSAY